MFTQTIGMDVAEARGARCVVCKWAPDLPTGAWPPFGEQGAYGVAGRGAGSCGWLRCKLRHYGALLVLLRASRAAGVDAAAQAARRELLGLGLV
jgi:hypothetical protein